MITVSGASFWLAEVSMTYWFVYFQFYWFPELRPQPFTGYCFLFALGYASLDWGIMQLPRNALLSALPATVLLLVELAIIWKNGRYGPAFIDVTVLTYLFVEFLDAGSLALTMVVTNVNFAASLMGTVTELLFSNVIFGILLATLWVTQTPMENLIRTMMGKSTEYWCMLFMLLIGVVFMLFEYSLQRLHWSPESLVFMASILGTLMMGLSLSTYFLLQTHLQQTHAKAQLQQQAFEAQYSTELDRQAEMVRKFRHDYQNMMLGLGGYLHDHDYDGFRQLYIDIRSGWETSNAADLTVDDLKNMPRGVVRYALYHDYLLAQQLGVALFVQIPQPLLATADVVRQVGDVLDQSLPPTIRAVQTIQPAMVTLKLTETKEWFYVQLTFPIPNDAKIAGDHCLVGPDFRLDFSGLLRHLSPQITSQLRVKLHWGQLLVMVPMR